MGIVNGIFSWYVKSGMEHIDSFIKAPFETQDKLLFELIQKAKDTEWGKKFNFQSIKCTADFRKQVPLNTYNDLKPYIERAMQGEQNVLWPTEIKWFAKSSGTTQDKSKFIPVSKESLNESHFKAGSDLYSLYYSIHNDASLIDGKALVMGGSHEVSTVGKGDTRFGDLSAVLLQNLPVWARLRSAPSIDTALIADWEVKIDKIAKETVDENITHMLGVPTWTVLLIKRLFEITGKNDLSEIWPNLELYIHGGVSFKPYRELFKSLISSPNMRYLETYNASEGFFAIQDRLDTDSMLLMLNYGIYYEFIPFDEIHKENPQTIGLEEVEIGKNYGLVITTNGGLWRYMIGDTVKFTSLDPFRLRVSGRTTHYINAFGEELVVENVDNALDEACKHTGAKVNDYTGAPVYFSGNSGGAHEYLIEFESEPDCINKFTKVFDDSLKKHNSDYEAKRFKSMALEIPKIHRVQKGSFYAWMKKCGKLGGQNKVPRLANDRRYIDKIMAFINEQKILQV